jgi:hypothetical protein
MKKVVILTETELTNLIKSIIKESTPTKNRRMDILKEDKQVGTLYHSSNLDNSKDIIKTNTLKTFNKDLNSLINYRSLRDDNIIFSPFGPILKDKTKIKPSISFSRNKMYKRDKDDVLFVIDGDKLSQKYKIVPYSQFGGRKSDEMEERLYRDITNLDKYIIKVILPFSDLEMESLLDEKNIPYQIN